MDGGWTEGRKGVACVGEMSLVLDTGRATLKVTLKTWFGHMKTLSHTLQCSKFTVRRTFIFFVCSPAFSNSLQVGEKYISVYNYCIMQSMLYQ